jgi:hypothetical protein
VTRRDPWLFALSYTENIPNAYRAVQNQLVFGSVRITDKYRRFDVLKLCGRKCYDIIRLKRKTVASALEQFVNNVPTLSAQRNIKVVDCVYEMRTWHT